MTDHGYLRDARLLGELSDCAAQRCRAVRERGAVIVSEAGRLLAVEGQYLGQTAELAGGAETAMHQHIHRLGGIKMQTAIRVVGAGPQAGYVETDVRRGQLAWINLEIGRVRRLVRGATANKDEKGDEYGNMLHGWP